ncbi:MAG TPA: hypothetical protein VIT23_15305 [Terrimicrobiaceae bacterium]
MSRSAEGVCGKARRQAIPLGRDTFFPLSLARRGNATEDDLATATLVMVEWERQGCDAHLDEVGRTLYSNIILREGFA